MELKEALRNANVQAFLHVIRAGESDQTDAAYTLLNGGAHFNSFADHPFAGQSAPPGLASGAYQFIPHTWGGLAKQFGAADFSPPWQDAMAVALIQQKGALDDVANGQLKLAIDKLATTWISLPGLGARAYRVFADFGGIAGPRQEMPPEAAAPTTEAKPMPALALLQLFAPILTGMIPQITALFNPKSEVAQRNVGVAQVVLDTITKVTGQPNLQGAIEAMQADPALKTKVQEAVVTHPEVIQLIEIGGGIAAAREADTKIIQSDNTFLRSPAFWITMLVFVPPIDYTIYKLVSQMAAPSENLITQVVTSILGLLAVIGAFYLGSSMGSQRKTELAADTKGA